MNTSIRILRRILLDAGCFVVRQESTHTVWGRPHDNHVFSVCSPSRGGTVSKGNFTAAVKFSKGTVLR